MNLEITNYANGFWSSGNAAAIAARTRAFNSSRCSNVYSDASIGSRNSTVITPGRISSDFFSITLCAPAQTIGTIGTPALIAITTAPRLNSPSRPSLLRVPSGYIKNDCPAFIASLAFSRLAIADSWLSRSTGMKCASVNACPTIGYANNDFFSRIAIRRGIAPTTAGASAELVWFATNKHAPAGILSKPDTSTRTPTARTKNITPFTPPQYSAAGFREITVQIRRGIPTTMQ